MDMPPGSHQVLPDQLAELEAFIERSETGAPEVSGWTVGQQIEHCCLSVRGVIAELNRSGDQAREPGLSAAGRLVFQSGQIPRGRGQAPQVTTPGAPPSREKLRRSIQKARDALGRFGAAPESATYEHPDLGMLDRDQAIRFLEIHNEHHLAIIRDILASAPGTDVTRDADPSHPGTTNWNSLDR